MDYTWRDVKFGERFVEIYTDNGGGRLTVDYGRLHDTEPAGEEEEGKKDDGKRKKGERASRK